MTRMRPVNSKDNTPADAPLDVPAVLLVGGFGTRLQKVVPSTPKALARVGEMPFLELLVLQLRSQGIQRLVMCTGHLAQQIEEQFGNGEKWDLAIQYSRETQPLGTAGALRHAGKSLAQASEFLVLNGDSFVEIDFREFMRFHRERGGLMTVAVRRVPDAARYGTVQVDSSGRVIRFSEKTGEGAPGVVNCGVYAFNRAILQRIPDGPASLERDLFPCLPEQGMYAFEQNGMFIDIGTPEDYARAQSLCRSLCQAAVAHTR